MQKSVADLPRAASASPLPPWPSSLPPPSSAAPPLPSSVAPASSPARDNPQNLGKGVIFLATFKIYHF